MNMYRTCSWRPLALWLACLACGGCASMSSIDGLFQPWGADDKFDEAQYGPAGNERLDALKAAANTGPKLSATEQQQLSEKLYAELQDEPSPVVRLYIIRAMAKLPTPTAATALRQAVKDEDIDVKVAACEAWGKRPGAEAIEALSGVLGSDADLDVRLAATRALGKMNTKEALPGLTLAIDDSDPALQRRAAESLRQVSGEDYGHDVEAWRAYVRGETPTKRRATESIADLLPYNPFK